MDPVPDHGTEEAVSAHQPLSHLRNYPHPRCCHEVVRVTIPAGNAAGREDLVGVVRERGNDARHHFLTVIAAIVGRFSLPLSISALLFGLMYFLALLGLLALLFPREAGGRRYLHFFEF
jgi:hypothetical protein